MNCLKNNQNSPNYMPQRGTTNYAKHQTPLNRIEVSAKKNFLRKAISRVIGNQIFEWTKLYIEISFLFSEPVLYMY